MAKKLSFALLLLLIIGGSAFAFAWWDNLTETEENQTLELGTGVRLELDETIATTDKILVPVGSAYASFTNDFTTAYTFTYTLSLEDDILEGYTETLLVNIIDFKIDGGAATLPHDVLVVEINGVEIDVSDNTVPFDFEGFFGGNAEQNENIVITISLPAQSESLTQAQYDSVAGKEITFTVVFTLEVDED